MSEDRPAAQPLWAVNAGPLTERVDKREVRAYHAACEVPDDPEATGFEEQKTRLVRRTPLGRVGFLVFGLPCLLLGLLMVLGGAVLLTDRVSTPRVVAVIFGLLIGWPGFAAVRAAFRQPYDRKLWERRFQLAGFARANGLSYVFRSAPGRWPGMLSKLPTRWGTEYTEVSKLRDLLEGADHRGRRFMICGLETCRCRGAVTARDLRFEYFVVVGLRLQVTTKQVFLRHRHSVRHDVSDLLEANFKLDDLYTHLWHPEDEYREYAKARPILTQELLELIVEAAPGHDLFLSGGWLYVMKPYDFADTAKKVADAGLMQERFDLIARLGAALAEVEAARARGEKAPEVPLTERQRRAREAKEHAGRKTSEQTLAAMEKQVARLRKKNDPAADVLERALAARKAMQSEDDSPGEGHRS